MYRFKKKNNSIPFYYFKEIFGFKSVKELKADLSHMFSYRKSAFKVNLGSIDFLRPDLSLPAYAGLVPLNGLSPIYNLFDRTTGGKKFNYNVTRDTSVDFRGENHTYDDHDGTDFVCPVGTKISSAAPGHIVMIRNRWLRGGLTISIDHGNGLITQYTHCWKSLVKLGQSVKRGESIALSGASGIDMFTSFPWVPPHIHFMVWHNGKPIDPFLSENEKDHTGTWIIKNKPTPSFFDCNEKVPEFSSYNKKKIDEIISRCKDYRTVRDLKNTSFNYHFIAAILEDALHHDNWAWKDRLKNQCIRTRENSSKLKITMPLSAKDYKGSYIADALITFRGIKKSIFKKHK